MNDDYSRWAREYADEIRRALQARQSQCSYGRAMITDPEVTTRDQESLAYFLSDPACKSLFVTL